MLARHSPDVAKCLRQDREWLWLTGDYRNDPETRELLKGMGFRFASKPHELPGGETARWFFATTGFRPEGRRRKRAVAKVKRAANNSRPRKDLLVGDNPDEEFEALFSST